MRERCSFEDGETCGWKIMDSSVTEAHAFRWSPDQGESIHDLEQYHRPVNDHTLWVSNSLEFTTYITTFGKLDIENDYSYLYFIAYSRNRQTLPTVFH